MENIKINSEIGITSRGQLQNVVPKMKYQLVCFTL